MGIPTIIACTITAINIIGYIILITHKKERELINPIWTGANVMGYTLLLTAGMLHTGGYTGLLLGIIAATAYSFTLGLAYTIVYRGYLRELFYKKQKEGA